uniref:Uncharacterized protein n=1 Tax=Arundo donax TaxID=35708 RepID=A0A0A8ZM32_ARUDO
MLFNSSLSDYSSFFRSKMVSIRSDFLSFGFLDFSNFELVTHFAGGNIMLLAFTSYSVVLKSHLL